MAEKMILQKVRDTLASWLGGSEACLDTRNVALLESMVSACDAHIAGMGEPVDVGLVERLRKRAAEERQIAENNARVAELLSPELALLEARDGPNIYAARMAIDHRDSAKKDAAFAHDLDAAADMIEAAIKGGA